MCFLCAFFLERFLGLLIVVLWESSHPDLAEVGARPVYPFSTKARQPLLKNRQLAKYTETNLLHGSPVLYEKSKVWSFRKDLCNVSLQGRAFMRKVNLSR